MKYPIFFFTTALINLLLFILSLCWNTACSQKNAISLEREVISLADAICQKTIACYQEEINRLYASLSPKIKDRTVMALSIERRDNKICLQKTLEKFRTLGAGRQTISEIESNLIACQKIFSNLSCQDVLYTTSLATEMPEPCQNAFRWLPGK